MVSMIAIRQRTSETAQRIWNPQWLQRRPKPLRIAIRAVAIFVLTLFLIWLVLFITKGRFLKGPFESIASSALEREVTVGGDFNLYFAPIDIKFLAEDMRISNPDWARSDDFFTAGLIDLRIRTFATLFGKDRVRTLILRDSDIALEWDETGERNTWTFGEAKAEPLTLPVRLTLWRTSSTAPFPVLYYKRPHAADQANLAGSSLPRRS